MIVRYVHRGMDHWVEASELTNLGRVTEVLGPLQNGTIQVGLVDARMSELWLIDQYLYPEIGEYVYEGWHRGDAKHVQFSASEMEVLVARESVPATL